MDASHIRERLELLGERLGELDVKSLSVFGSAARGEFGQASDLDFLVEFHGPATFDRYMDLEELLEGEFQTPIDLVTKRALKPSLRESILGEAIRVA